MSNSFRRSCSFALSCIRWRPSGVKFSLKCGMTSSAVASDNWSRYIEKHLSNLLVSAI